MHTYIHKYIHTNELTYLQIPLHDLLGARVGVLVEPLVEEAELPPREPPAEDEHELLFVVDVDGCD